MKFIKLSILLLGLFMSVACSPSPTSIWLKEYEALLIQAAQVMAQDPFSPESERIRGQIAEKEAEVDSLLRNSSIQDQMSFLSYYYDIRVKFYYAAQ